MSLPGVTINIGNGAIGTAPSTTDGVVGMILSGTAPASLQLGTAKVIYALQDAIDLGIDDTHDAYAAIKEFYDQAGDGAELWIMIAADTVTLADMADKTGDYAPKLLNAAGGRIRVLGINRIPEDSYTPTVSEGLDDDVFNALTNAQALANDETANNVSPIRVVIGGRGYTGNSGDLRDLKSGDQNRVQILLSSVQADGYPAVGLLMGKYARIPVQRNVGRVKDGALPVTDAFMTDGSVISDPEVAAVHDLGYVAIRSFIGKSGFYFTDNPTATADTDDYSSLARGRVIDKAFLIAYDTYTNEVNDEIAVDEDGKMDTGRLKELQSKVENAINQTMTNNGEISSVGVFIDPEQNVLATGKVTINLQITPVGYMKTIEVNLGFNNPYNG